jgi:[acyl-carrier-protein] S-malonyltransferase
MGTKALVVFPGQGSQFSGMGRAYAQNFPLFAQTLEEASDACGLHLKKLSLDASDSDIKESSVAQPLILSVSIGMWRVLQANFGIENKFKATFAGHSLGEYTALVAAECFSLAECVRAVQSRGQFMSEAVPPGVGGMRALILKEAVEESKIKALCAEATKKSGKLVCMANWNMETQIVLSGYEEGLKIVDQLAGTDDWKWVRRSIVLEVSGPFHSPLMEKALEKFSPVLDQLKFVPQEKDYIRNVDATMANLQSDYHVRQALREQVCGSVRWYPTLVAAKAAGVQAHVEISPSKVLTNMASRMAEFKEWKFFSFEDPLKIEETLKN